MIDDANKRFYRRCDEFAICVNIGKAGLTLPLFVNQLKLVG